MIKDSEYILSGNNWRKPSRETDGNLSLNDFRNYVLRDYSGHNNHILMTPFKLLYNLISI